MVGNLDECFGICGFGTVSGCQFLCAGYFFPASGFYDIDGKYPTHFLRIITVRQVSPDGKETMSPVPVLSERKRDSGRGGVSG